MKKSVNLYFYNTDTKRKIDAIKNAGYDGIFLSYKNNTENMTLEEQIEYCKKINLEVSMIHCEYNIQDLNNFWLENNKIADEAMNFYIHQIESIAQFNVSNFVMHANGPIQPTLSKFGLKRIENILKTCEKYNINLCIENLEYPSVVEYILENIKHPNLYFCYDTGHKNCFAPDSEIAKKYNSKLIINHIHDNLGFHDDHLILGSGTIDIDNLANEMKDCKAEYLSAEIRYKNSELSIDEILQRNLKSLTILDEKITQLNKNN